VRSTYVTIYTKDSSMLGTIGGEMRGTRLAQQPDKTGRPAPKTRTGQMYKLLRKEPVGERDPRSDDQCGGLKLSNTRGHHD